MRSRLVILMCSVAACVGTPSRVAESSGFGPHPLLPAPEHSLLPVINLSTAKGWPPGKTPWAATGTVVRAFASGLDHPRWLYVLPNGDVLVAETNAPPRPDDGKSLKGKVTKELMKKTGASVPSANRLTLLRDTDGDGVADVRTPFLVGLDSPFGMALVDGQLYVANADRLVRFAYTDGATQLTGSATNVLELPGGPINHHWTKNVIANRAGTKLYVSVGSNSNAAENGLAAEEGRAAIWEVDVKTWTHRLFATGLRNPVGMAYEPSTQTLWTSVNERAGHQIGPLW
jgi:glucose/arabinose dehydrogenase